VRLWVSTIVVLVLSMTLKLGRTERGVVTRKIDF
jgi:hypothetical protein